VPLSENPTFQELSIAGIKWASTMYYLALAVEVVYIVGPKS